MLLTIEELVRTLRISVNVQQEEAEVIDPAYLSMSDEDLILFVKLAVSRAYPNVIDLSELPNGSDYPVVLLAKIELYTKLAVMKADKVDMGADNNNYLKQDQRFQHYMKLIDTTKSQYENWLDNEGQGEVSSFDVLLDSRHYTHRNYEKQVKPKVTLGIDTVTTDSIDFHWKVSNTSHFGRFKVFISKSPIVDMFTDGSMFHMNHVSSEAVLVLSTSDIRHVQKRLLNLDPETTYYIAVLSVERNQVWGFAEMSFNTLPVIAEEEDVDIEEFHLTGSEV